MRRPIHKPKNQNFNKMVGLKVYSNLNASQMPGDCPGWGGGGGWGWAVLEMTGI